MVYCIDVWLEQTDLRLLALRCCTKPAKVAAALWYSRGGRIHVVWKEIGKDGPRNVSLPSK